MDMSMVDEKIRVNYLGKVEVHKEKNKKELYEHQIDAMKALDELNKKNSFSTILVLPTGGGKTLTSCYWLLKNAVDKNKKILWIAHRHLLLEQGAETFQKNAYLDLLPNKTSFNFRIVSGKHDRAINIKKTDDIVIASKDSIVRNINVLDKWIKGEKEVYLVIDEAHHAAAKTYKTIINYMKKKVKNIKILGLTATPFRTSEAEKGVLKKIFSDDIVYKIDLKDLINKGILSRPHFDEFSTEIVVGEGIGLKEIKSIEYLDCIPEDVANMIAANKERNNKIVKHYTKNKEKFKQTIVFALNRMHAIALRGIFKKNGIKSAVIVSGITSEFIGIDVSNEENERNIREYKEGKIQVLINVNILTEGVDLPKTETVFLTRPTISSILMTQMVGRALRGEKAGGTKDAYVISFIDKWQEHIAWANPENLTEDLIIDIDSNYSYIRKEITKISIQKIEEFAKIIDDTVNTEEIEKIPYNKRIPLGMYSFSFIDTDKEDTTIERNYQVLIYDSTKKQYEDFIKAIPEIFKEYNLNSEFIDDKVLARVCKDIEKAYFYKNMLPSYDEKDIKNIIKYYAQKECAPDFKTFDEIDRNKLDLEKYAKEIYRKNMRRSEKNQFINNIWDDESGVVKIYYNKKLYFTRQLEIELDKIRDGYKAEQETPNIVFGEKAIKELSLYEIEAHLPEEARKIKEAIFNKFKNEQGFYVCNKCGKVSATKISFEIDHIKPMAKGGITILDNLQLLCKSCNRNKGDKYE